MPDMDVVSFNFFVMVYTEQEYQPGALVTKLCPLFCFMGPYFVLEGYVNHGYDRYMQAFTY